MGTVIRAEVSKKNEYWIEKHRYYELKHFCLQYDTWAKAYESLDGLSKNPDGMSIVSKEHQLSDPTAKCALAKEEYRRKMDLVLHAASQADEELSGYILMAVTKGLSYNSLRVKCNIPCSRDVFYNRYRKFFWLLNKTRN